MTLLAQVLTYWRTIHLECKEKGVLRLTRSYLASDAESPFCACRIANWDHGRAV